MDKFTPGPWLCVGRIVYALNDRGYNSFHCGVQDSFTPESELIANAQLIAAAPDLLAELQNIANAKRADFEDAASFRDWAQNRARFAIEKATKGSQ